MREAASWLFILLLYAPLSAADFRVNIADSTVGFTLRHMLFSHVNGRFEKFQGKFSLNEKNQKITQLEGTAEVASLNTQNKKRDNYIKNKDLFEAAKYPIMRLKLITQKGSKAIVDLTIKNVTQTITMKIDDINPNGFAMHGKISRKDFHLRFGKLIDGTGMVGDNVKIKLKIKGIPTNRK